jgi:hypothetical protein
VVDLLCGGVVLGDDDGAGTAAAFAAAAGDGLLVAWGKWWGGVWKGIQLGACEADTAEVF